MWRNQTENGKVQKKGVMLFCLQLGRFELCKHNKMMRSKVVFS